MTNSESSRRFDVEIDLTLQFLAIGTANQSIQASTDNDGTIRIASRGKFPRLGFSQMRQVRDVLTSVAAMTFQDIVVEHNDRQLAHLRVRSSKAPRWSFRPWTIVWTWLQRR